MSDAADDLRHELQVRLQELERLSLEVRHLQADLQVKDDYIAVLRNETPATQAELISARRYLTARSRLRAALRCKWDELLRGV